jgi:CheY-like chemotaxis protein
VAGNGCVGCLGSGRCWVCLGTGFAYPEFKRGECTRCGGDRICDLCRGEAAVASFGASRRVLLIDDEVSVSTLLELWLGDDPRCAAVAMAPSGDAAFAELAEHTPDTILCDYHLGDVTSEAYLPGFRSAAPHARIFIHTSDPHSAREAGVLDLGADAIVEKGRLTLDELVDMALAPDGI